MAENSRKRRRIDPVEICQQVYEVIRNYKKEDGSLLCDAFIRAPKRRQEPAYYDVVSNPIDMLRIQQKIRTDEYEELEQMTTDVELLVANAKAFYAEDKPEHQDAISLWEVYQQAADRLNEDEVAPKLVAKVKKKAPSSSPMESGEDSEESRDTFSEIDEMAFEELFAAVMHATSSDGRLLHSAFQLLPSKKLYPDYYQVIDMPIDLKQIAIKIQSNEYTNLTEMENDLNLMIRNACTYNEPGSQISKDAKMLKKIITSRKAEIEHSRQTGGKTSERIRYNVVFYRL